MKDAAFNRSREYQHYYRVGSCFKGCHNCGDVVLSEDSDAKRYTSGFQVFRSYDPKALGWTYWCYECGAKDQACWENANDIGEPPYRGPKAGKPRYNAAPKQTVQPVKQNTDLEDQVAELRALAEKIKALLTK
jgi:hypothetical protein